MLIVNPPLDNVAYKGLTRPNNIFVKSVVHLGGLICKIREPDNSITNKIESFINVTYPILNRQSNLPYDNNLAILVPNIFNQISDEVMVSKLTRKNVSPFNIQSDLRNNNAIAALIKFANGHMGFAIVRNLGSDRSDKKFITSLYLNDHTIESAHSIKDWVTDEIMYLHLTLSDKSSKHRYYERFDIREKHKYDSGNSRHLIKRAYYPNEFECDICLDSTCCPGVVYLQYMESNNLDYITEPCLFLPDSYTVSVPEDFIKQEPVNIIQSAPINITTIDKKRQNKLENRIRSTWKIKKTDDMHEFLENYSGSGHKYTRDPDSFKKLMHSYEERFDATEALYYFIKTGKPSSSDERWLDITLDDAFKLTKSTTIKQVKRKLPRKTEASEEPDKIKVRVISRNPTGKHDRVIAVYHSIINNKHFENDPELQKTIALNIVENKKKDCFNKLFDLLINRFGGYDRINRRLKKLIDNSSVYMAIHPHTLNTLLKDPEHEIKSGVEVGQGSGADPMGAQRLQIEVLRMQSNLYNYNSLKKYGFISTKDYPLVDGRIRQYGSIIFEFHDYIKEKTTITFGDSFGNFTQPISMLNPDIKLLAPGLFHESYHSKETSLFNFIRSLDSMYACLKNLMKRSMLRQGLNIAGVINSGYVEAQITDKLTLEDVKTIYVATDKLHKIYRDAIINPDKVPENIHFALYTPRDYNNKISALLYSHIKKRRPALKN